MAVHWVYVQSIMLTILKRHVIGVTAVGSVVCGLRCNLSGFHFGCYYNVPEISVGVVSISYIVRMCSGTALKYKLCCLHCV